LRAIADKGVESVRLIDVAQVAGVSIGALQHHFGSRDALVLAAYQLQAQETLQAVTALSDEKADSWSSLAAIIDYAGSGEARDAVLWLELCASAFRIPTLRPIVDEINATWNALIREVVERGLADGTFTSSLRPESLVEAIDAIIDGMLVAIASGRTGGEDAGPQMLKVIAQLAGVAGRAPT